MSIGDTSKTTPLTSGGTTSDRPVGWLTRLRARLGLPGSPTIRDVIEEALEEEAAESTSSLSTLERQMLQRILHFGDLRVEDVMVPRADIIAIDEEAPLSALLEGFHRAGHSRVPVYHETLDDLRGMIHIKDLVSWLVENSARKAEDPGAEKPDETRPQSTNGVSTDEHGNGRHPHLALLDLSGIDLNQPISATKIRRPVLFVPPSMPAINLLLRMQSTHIHLAMVVDEYGGTDGLVSIEDLVEEIVGQIEDEHDELEIQLQPPDATGAIVASARAPIADLEAQLGFKLVDEEDLEDFDTLAGLVFSLAGRVPVRGELVPHPSGIEFEVLDADPRRIIKLKVHTRPRNAGKPKSAA